jgi:hypothetical protein
VLGKRISIAVELFDASLSTGSHPNGLRNLIPIVGLSYIENLILDAGIAGISTDLLLLESEEEVKTVAFASAGPLTNDSIV